MQDRLLIVTKVKKSIDYIEKIISNYPHKEMVLKNKIIASYYDLLEIVYKVNIHKEEFYMREVFGVGKTHLAVALGIEAAKHRNSVYFITCHNLMMKLNKAQKENRLEKQLQHLAQYKVLIIDEIGYLPVDHQGSNLFFQLIARRYMSKSTIVTTNMPFSRWGEVFSDNTLASAVLDRLLHYSHIIRITGNSYRIKDKIVETDSKTNKYEE
ncbi:MAG: ATP-binding protein [Bacilli bacterium]|nr:ATP-binding protein [Bacilli bacterium]